MKPAKSKKRYILRYIFVAFIFTWAGALLFRDTAKTRTESATASHSDATNSFTKQDQVLLGYLKDIKAAYISDLNISYINKYNDGRTGDYTPPYDGDTIIDETKTNKKIASITILSGRSADETKRTLAHEYIHHIWYTKLNRDEQNILSSNLISSYGKDQGMQAHLLNYSNKNTLTPDELFSAYCADSSDSFLTTDILATCNKYIDRSALVMLR